MRGKLRDKRPYSKTDLFKREENEQRRPYKRTVRTTLWDQQLEGDEFYDAMEDELMEDVDDADGDFKLPNKK